MKFSRLFPLAAIALLAAPSLSAQQTEKESQPQEQYSIGGQAPQLKIINSPTVPYPEEALKKNVEGKVVLRIVVDSRGRVSDAKVLSGPPELFQAALDSVKQWEFEPPTHAPVITNAEVSYGHPKECPGPVSNFGEVSASTRLRSARGTVVDISDGADWVLPEYFTEDRKAGVAGEMVLSITVNAEGTVASVGVVKSLSPHLDNAAIDSVRTLKFKLKAGGPGSLPDDFPLHIFYRPTCHMEF